MMTRSQQDAFTAGAGYPANALREDIQFVVGAVIILLAIGLLVGWARHLEGHDWGHTVTGFVFVGFFFWLGFSILGLFT